MFLSTRKHCVAGKTYHARNEYFEPRDALGHPAGTKAATITQTLPLLLFTVPLFYSNGCIQSMTSNHLLFEVRGTRTTRKERFSSTPQRSKPIESLANWVMSCGPISKVTSFHMPRGIFLATSGDSEGQTR